MSFHIKLNYIMQELKIKNSALSKITMLDSSLISRYRSGKRAPSRNSPHLHAIAEGVTSLSVSKQQKEFLMTLHGLTNETENVIESLYSYLNDESLIVKKTKEKHRKQRKKLVAFGEKLDILMNVLNVSNIRLARAVNVDSSLISKFRNGVRNPAYESNIISKISEYLTKTALISGKTDICEILNLESFEIMDESLLKIAIEKWLGEAKDLESENATSKFLDKLDTFKCIEATPSIDIKYDFGQQIFAENYIGNDGMRQVVIRFLTSVLSSDCKTTLYLYSDQNMAWLTENPEFAKTWGNLMTAVLLKGNKIKIVHTIQRDISELFSAIENWMPLYMLGGIEPYYIKRQKDSLFCRSLFVAENAAAVTSNCVARTEYSAYIIYSTEKKQIEYQTNQFKELLSFCSPLLSVFTKKDNERFILRYNDFSRQPGNIKSLLTTPSFLTMPRELLISVLERNLVPHQAKKRIVDFYDYEKKRFYRNLEEFAVYECSAIPPADDSEKMRVEIPVFLYDSPIYYSHTEYAEHIKNIVSIKGKYANYNFTELPISPFSNIEVLLKEGVGFFVSKKNEPHIVFMFENNILCNTFSNYLNTLIKLQ